MRQSLEIASQVVTALLIRSIADNVGAATGSSINNGWEVTAKRPTAVDGATLVTGRAMPICSAPSHIESSTELRRDPLLRRPKLSDRRGDHHHQRPTAASLQALPAVPARPDRSPRGRSCGGQLGETVRSTLYITLNLFACKAAQKPTK